MYTCIPLGDTSTGSMTNRPTSGDNVNRLRSNNGDWIQPRLVWAGARGRASVRPASSRPKGTPPDKGFAIPLRSVAFIGRTPFYCLRGGGFYFLEPKTGFQTAPFVREVFDVFDTLSAHNLHEGRRSERQRSRHPQCGARIFADGLSDKLIGEA